MFDGLMEKLESNFEPTMQSQMGRLRASTVAFQKIANGYTQKKYLARQSFLEFLEKDILSSAQDKTSESAYESAHEQNQSFEDFVAGEEESRRRTMLRINQRSRNNEAVGIIVNPLDENANSKVTSE